MLPAELGKFQNKPVFLSVAPLVEWQKSNRAGRLEPPGSVHSR
jgi:hypothetical protein